MKKKLFKKSLVSVMVVGGLLTASLVGCEQKITLDSGKKATVESIFTDSKNAHTDAKSVDMTLDLGVDGSIGNGEGTSMKVTFDADLDVKSENEKGIYCKGDVKFNVLGMSQEQSIETYASLNGDSQMSYSYDSENDTWTKSEMDFSGVFNADMIKQLNTIDFTKVYNKLTLAEKTEDFNGTESYHISGDITGTDMKEVITQIKDILGESIDEDALESANLDSIVVGTDFYFAKEDAKLLGIKMDFSKTDFLKLLISEESNKDLSTAEFTDFHINLTVNSVNDYTFEVPSDIIDNTVDEEDSSSYTFRFTE